jgi:hypothetical protein
MRSRLGPKFFRPDDASETHEVPRGVFVGPARVCVRQIGELLDLGRHIGEFLKLGRGQHPRNTGGGNLDGKLDVVGRRHSW